MISVKDRDVMKKRQAFLKTIQYHKDQANSHQNAVFASTKDRFGSTKKEREDVERASNQVRQAYDTQTIQNSTTGLSSQKLKTNFGLSF